MCVRRLVFAISTLFDAPKLRSDVTKRTSWESNALFDIACQRSLWIIDRIVRHCWTPYCLEYLDMNADVITDCLEDIDRWKLLRCMEYFDIDECLICWCHCRLVIKRYWLTRRYCVYYCNLLSSPSSVTGERVGVVVAPNQHICRCDMRYHFTFLFYFYMSHLLVVTAGSCAFFSCFQRTWNRPNRLRNDEVITIWSYDIFALRHFISALCCYNNSECTEHWSRS